MKKIFFTTTTHIALFAGLLAVLWLMLDLCCMIPNDAIRSNYLSSVDNYKTAPPFEFTDGGSWNSISDNYADSILLGVSWNMGAGDPFISSVNTGYNDGGEQGENYGLYISVHNNEPANTDYTRYWHGSAIFVRLLHLFTDVEGIKLIGFVSAILFIIFTEAILIKRRHYDIALVLIVSLVFIQFWNIRLSLEYLPPFVITFLLCPLYLWLERKSNTALTLLSVASGTMVAFFDFLTTETVTILVPLLLLIAVRMKEERLSCFKDGFLLITKCGICWGCAYGAAFLVKWGLAAAVCGEDIFTLALSSVTERISGEIPEAEGAMKTVFDALFANITVLFGGTQRIQMNYVIAGTVLFAAVLASIWYLFRKKGPRHHANALMAILGLLVPLRYIVLNNHSYLHEFFTYRALISTVLAALLVVTLNIAPPSKNKKARKGRK